MISAKAAVALFWLSVVAWASVALRSSFPIAIDKHPTGKLYMLDYTGTVSARDASGQVQPVGRLPWGTRPIDILSAQLNKQELLFICLVSTEQRMMQQNSPGMAQTGAPNSANYGGAGQIIRMAADGRVLDTWNLPVACGGLDIDPGQHRIYFANSQAGEVFSIDVDQGEPSISRVGFIRGAKSLGPLAVDAGKNKLYTADVLSGTVFSLDLETRESRALSHDFGEPQALALSPDGEELYIADGLKHVVWKLPLPGGGSPVPFSGQNLGRPIGVAIGTNGHLWVADAGAREVIDLAPSAAQTEPGKKASKKKAKKKGNSEQLKHDQ